MATNQYEFLFKYIRCGRIQKRLGDVLLTPSHFALQEYTPTETTIGIEFGSQVVSVRDKKIKLQIWDTAGQESFRSISRAYYRGAIGCLLSLDETRINIS
ncbi:hypothetical protein HK104_009844 [Borealophlyctis nickersoniae]|nr:hypothetical protein HK104_009844 [Borealophlyctis nickersoniae]